MGHYNETFVHWHYYLAIENDLEKMSRYIEFSKFNHVAFSVELARIILAAGAETECLLRKLCQKLDSENKHHNFFEYLTAIEAYAPGFITETVQMPKFGMHYQPWVQWLEGENSPDWWRANNKLKNDRTEFLQKANLKNACSAVGALLITTVYYYKTVLREQGKEADIEAVFAFLKPVASLFFINTGDYEFVDAEEFDL